MRELPLACKILSCYLGYHSIDYLEYNGTIGSNREHFILTLEMEDLEANAA